MSAALSGPDRGLSNMLSVRMQTKSLNALHCTFLIATMGSTFKSGLTIMAMKENGSLCVHLSSERILYYNSAG
eukprot:4078838-Amphidinium_carterae.1